MTTVPAKTRIVKLSGGAEIEIRPVSDVEAFDMNSLDGTEAQIAALVRAGFVGAVVPPGTVQVTPRDVVLIAYEILTFSLENQLARIENEGRQRGN
jgi:hypothetical protein